MSGEDDDLPSRAFDIVISIGDFFGTWRAGNKRIHKREDD